VGWVVLLKEVGCVFPRHYYYPLAIDVGQVKVTAGRIIPALATTTCLITGLVCIELYKLAQVL
jgi:hypothetical protein